MIGIYFSGTGNTKHCMELLVSLVDETAECISMTDERVRERIQEHDVIYLGYPVQFSNTPYFVRDFIRTNRDLWKNRRVLCLTTMGAFSGDGAGCSARLLKKYGAIILGGLHIRMPDAVCDSKMLKKSREQNRQILRQADEKILRTAAGIRAGKYPAQGISFGAHLCGLFGQRLWFYGKTAGYSDQLKISDACVGCGKCVALCPMGNLELKDGKAEAAHRCTMCYSCISQCPRQAITLLGKEVVEQCRYEHYC